MVTPKTLIEWLHYAIGKVEKNYFDFTERVYCYELYHFLRVAMRGSNKIDPAQNLHLHSELTKKVLASTDAVPMGVYPLAGLRSPDFILHDPDTINHQIAAMEVKANPNITYTDFIEDIRKLSELRKNYHFKLAIFHCINIERSRIRRYITKAQKEKLNLDPEIHIVIKSNYHAGIEQVQLGKFLRARSP